MKRGFTQQGGRQLRREAGRKGLCWDGVSMHTAELDGEGGGLLGSGILSDVKRKLWSRLG